MKSNVKLAEQVELVNDIEAICVDYDLAMRLPRSVIDAAAKLSMPDLRSLPANRRDLRDLPLVTIDAADAKDFDDAVHCCKGQDGEYILTVVIADVAEFVTAESLLDNEARQRATSAYFPGTVLPMLPPHLSNELCSLQPQQERLGLACEACVDRHGKVRNYEFFECVISSWQRLTYQEAEEKFKRDSTDSEVQASLQSLVGLTRLLEQKRTQRGGLQIDLMTRSVGIDKGGSLVFIESKRLFAHSVIEECMLIANISAATMLHRHKYPFLYRVHAKPDTEKIKRLQQVMREFGIQVGKLDEPRKMQKVIDSVADQPPLVAWALTMNILRTLMRAQYTPRNVFHYGLGFKRYTHFTSPIRRYPDLLVHRAIKAVLQGKKPPQGLEDKLLKIGVHCSEREMAAERAGLDVYARVFGKQQLGRIGEVMEGSVTGMSKGGMFVVCADGLEGRVAFSSMRDDYYELNAVQTAAIGRRRRRVLHVGMLLTVRLVNVNQDNGRCELALQN